MTRSKKLLKNILSKAQPLKKPIKSIEYYILINFGLCPYCNNEVITVDYKEVITADYKNVTAIEYCPLCDVAWKLIKNEEENITLVDEVSLDPTCLDDF